MVFSAENVFVRIGWNVNSSKNNDGVIIIFVGEDEKVLVGSPGFWFGFVCKKPQVCTVTFFIFSRRRVLRNLLKRMLSSETTYIMRDISNEAE